jgi:hypothetical protein
MNTITPGSGGGGRGAPGSGGGGRGAPGRGGGGRGAPVFLRWKVQQCNSVSVHNKGILFSTNINS